MATRHFRILILLTSSLLAACWMGWGQTAGTGALSGTVTDQSGGLVSNATVSAIREATGEVRTGVTAAAGNYTLPLLPPGTYRVEVRKEGFKLSVQSGITVVLDETASVLTHLEVGATAEAVNVTANAEVLNTESSSLGTVTNTRMVNDLPLASRNYTQIIALNAGIATEVQNASALGRGGAGPSGAVAGSPDFAAHGGTSEDNNFKIDGVDANDIQSSGNFNSGVAVPNPDAIQEFKVQTGQYDASYGRNAGANVDLITKSGSNQFHGNLFEYFRNEDMNANDFFRNEVGLGPGILRQNQYGLTFGGPIIKDKLFFFTSWQGTRQLNGVNSSCSANIYSPAFTNDRSAAALGKLFGGQRGALQGGAGPAIAADGSNINPAALAILQYKLPNGQYLVPTPQTFNPSASFNLQGFSSYSQACTFNEDQFLTNVDYDQSSKSRFAFRYFWANDFTTQAFPSAPFGGAMAPGSPYDTTNNFRNLAFTHTYLFTPSLLNEAVFGFHHSSAIDSQITPFKWSDMGVNATGADNNFPVLSVLGGFSVGGNGQGGNIVESTYVFDDTLSYTHGRQSFRFGGGYTRYLWDVLDFNFGGVVGALSWADVLLGLNASQNGSSFSNIFITGDIPGNFSHKLRIGDADAFVQDDVKLTSRLNVNLGLRYEYLGSYTDNLGNLGSFNFGLANPNAPSTGSAAGYVVASNYPGTLPTGVTRSSNASATNNNGLNTWNPRVGFAYRLPKTERMVLRGGYGIAHSRIAGQALFNQLLGPPFGIERFPSGLSTASSTLQNPFGPVPAFPSFSPYSLGTNLGFLTLAPGIQPPMIQTYNVQLETKLSNSLVLQVGYVGQRGLHMLETVSQNQALLATVQNPIRGFTTNTLANLDQRVPFLGLTPNGAQYTQSEGQSWYNGLEVSLNKHFSHGLQFLASYTFAKDMSTDLLSTSYVNGGQAIGNQNSASSRYGPDQFIRPHRFVLSYLYEIPSFGSPKSFATAVLGGWSLSGVTTIQAGQRLSILNTNGNNIYGITSDRAQMAPGCTYGQIPTSGSVQSRLNNYFNKACFTNPPVIGDDGEGTTFGNSGVGIVSGPGQFNFDASLAKRISLRWPSEVAGLQFRVEGFNLFNHPQFANPDNTFSDGTFGTITALAVNPRILQLALKLNF